VVNLSSFNVNVANGADAKVKVNAAGKGTSFSWNRIESEAKNALTESTKYVGVKKQELKITRCADIDAGTYVCDITMAGTTTTLSTSPISVSVILPYMSGNFTAPIARTPLLGVVNGGRVDMTVATTGAVTGKVFLGAQTLPFTGVLAGTTPSTGIAEGSIVVSRPGGNLTLEFTLGADNLLTGGSLSDGSEVLNFDGWRNTFTASSSGSSYAGLYNLALGLPGGSLALGDAAIPQGSGFASFTVSTKGEFSITGKSADGQTLTASSFVGPSGQGLFYHVLYPTLGPATLLGVFTIDAKSNTTPSDNTLAGTASWNRPSDAGALARTYKAGFDDVALAVEGSFYAPPVSPLVFLDLSASTGSDNARLLFSGGDIESASSATLSVLTPRSFRIGTSSAVTIPLVAASAALKLTVTAAAGAFKGEFILKDETVARPKTLYEGRVYKKGSNLVGAGYFLHDRGTSLDILSGAVFLEKL
jgi:hypothetical protein